jgi:hypothetical protein
MGITEQVLIISELYALSSVDFEMYCCVIFPSPNNISLRTFWGSLWMVHVNHNLSIGVWLWQCCSLSMEHSIQIGKGADCIGSDACAVSKHICTDHSRSAFWFSAAFISLSSLQPIKALLSSTLPTSPFWLVHVYPDSFRGLFRRLYFVFQPPQAFQMTKSRRSVWYSNSHATTPMACTRSSLRQLH